MKPCLNAETEYVLVTFFCPSVSIVKQLDLLPELIMEYKDAFTMALFFIFLPHACFLPSQSLVRAIPPKTSSLCNVCDVVQMVWSATA